MIPIGKPEHLGKRTLIIMIIQGLLPSVALLFLVIFLSLFKESFSSFMTTSLYTVSEITPVIGNSLYSFIPNIIPTIFLLAILFGGIGTIISSLRYNFFTFSIEEFGLKLRKGILKVIEINIHYRQMQNVDITRPLIYRLLGLSRLVIFSAGHEQAGEEEQTDTTFDPIDFEIAEEIKELLGRRIGVQVIEHESEADAEAKNGFGGV